MMGGERLHGPTVVGMVIGFAGTALLSASFPPAASALQHYPASSLLRSGVVGMDARFASAAAASLRKRIRS